MAICFLCSPEIKPQIDELIKSLLNVVKQGKVKPKKRVEFKAKED